MFEKVTHILNRARYAATGAAIGAFVGGLISRNAASTGAALGALVVATIGEKRGEFDALVDRLGEVRDDGLQSDGESETQY